MPHRKSDQAATPNDVEPTSPGASGVNSFSECRRRLVLEGSIELTSGIDSLERGHRWLTPGTRVFVPSLPKRSIHENLDKLRRIRALGFEPVPHVAARRLTGEDELRRFLQIATGEIGIRTLLLIGGDAEHPAGPFESTEAVLRSGAIQDAGIAKIGIAGYPGPHPMVSDEVLCHSLDAKLSWAADTGTRVFLVTQFSLSEDHVVRYCNRLAAERPGLPVYVGIPGPTPVTRLLNFARMCGVGTAARALGGMGLQAARLGRRGTSDRQLEAIGRFCSESSQHNVQGIHVFSFGGFAESAEWMNERTRD